MDSEKNYNVAAELFADTNKYKFTCIIEYFCITNTKNWFLEAFLALDMRDISIINRPITLNT